MLPLEEREEGKEEKAEEEDDKKEAMWFKPGISDCPMANGQSLPRVPPKHKLISGEFL